MNTKITIDLEKLDYTTIYEIRDALLKEAAACNVEIKAELAVYKEITEIIEAIDEHLRTN